MSQNQTKTNHTTMKLFLSALCASFIIAPLSFSAPAAELKQEVLAGACGKCDCDKCKNGKCSDCDKCKKAELLADCGKCKKKDGDKEEEKKEGTLAGDKCKKDGECDKDKKEEGTLAHCGKCGKDKEKKEEEKKEGTLA